MVGAPAQTPRAPLWLAGNGPKAIRYAATHGDGWITTGAAEEDRETWWRGVAEVAARFDEAAAESGRGDRIARVLSLDDEVAYSLRSAASYLDDVARAAELGFTDVVAHWPRESGLYAGSEAVLDEVAGILSSTRA